jgi:hypothetical protein
MNPTKRKTDDSHVISDRDGTIIQRSRNLAGIRRYVGQRGTPAIKRLAVDRIGDWEGKLSILFENGASYETNFGSFKVLASFVYRWRNVRGSPLLINGKPAIWDELNLRPDFRMDKARSC